MCVLNENLSSRRLPSGDELLYELFPLERGVVVRLDRGANLLLTECGDGELLCYLSGMFPRSRFAGLDPSAATIIHARRLAREAGRQNLWYEAIDAGHHHFGCKFHLILSIAAAEPAVDHDFAALHANLHYDGVLFLRDDAGTATDGLYRAGFSNIRHIILPNESLSHVYIARK